MLSKKVKSRIFFLFFLSIKELLRQEKLFLNEFGQSRAVKIVVDSQKENTKKVLSGNSVF